MIPAISSARLFTYAICPDAFRINTGRSETIGSRSRVIRSRGGSSRMGSNWRPITQSPMAAALSRISRTACNASSNVGRWNGPMSSRCPSPAISAKCICGSIKPGSTTRPARSTVLAPRPAAARTSSPLPTARTLLPAIANAACTENGASTGRTVPFMKTVTSESAIGSCCFPQPSIVEPSTAPAPYTNCRRLNALINSRTSS